MRAVSLYWPAQKSWMRDCQYGMGIFRMLSSTNALYPRGFPYFLFSALWSITCFDYFLSVSLWPCGSCWPWCCFEHLVAAWRRGYVPVLLCLLSLVAFFVAPGYCLGCLWRSFGKASNNSSALLDDETEALVQLDIFWKQSLAEYEEYALVVWQPTNVSIS